MTVVVIFFAIMCALQRRCLLVDEDLIKASRHSHQSLQGAMPLGGKAREYRTTPVHEIAGHAGK